MRLRVFVCKCGCAKGACKTWDLITAINARAVNTVKANSRGRLKAKWLGEPSSRTIPFIF
jgi:hypothetical protein